MKDIKDYFIEGNLPYYQLSFHDKDRTRIRMFAIYHQAIKKVEELVLQFKVYGDDLDDMHGLYIRQRDNALNEVSFPVQHVADHIYEASIP